MSAFIYRWYCIGVVGLCKLEVDWGLGGMSALGMSGCLCSALSIVSTEESTASSSFKVVHLCSNTLDY